MILDDMHYHMHVCLKCIHCKKKLSITDRFQVDFLFVMPVRIASCCKGREGCHNVMGRREEVSILV